MYSGVSPVKGCGVLSSANEPFLQNFFSLRIEFLVMASANRSLCMVHSEVILQRQEDDITKNGLGHGEDWILVVYDLAMQRQFQKTKKKKRKKFNFNAFTKFFNPFLVITFLTNLLWNCFHSGIFIINYLLQCINMCLSFFFFLGVVVRNCLNCITTVISTTMIVRRNHFFG